MALTYTPAGLQTQCDLVATAIDGGDFVTARSELAKAGLILIGLPEEVAAGGTITKMRKSLADYAAILETAASSSGASDRRRFIRTGLSHG